MVDGKGSYHINHLETTLASQDWPLHADEFKHLIKQHDIYTQKINILQN